MNCKSWQLQKLLFENRQLSRQELIRLSGFNPRTVSRCQEEFLHRELVRPLAAPHGGQSYEVCREKIRFASFTLCSTELFFTLCDWRGIPGAFTSIPIAAARMPAAELIALLPEKCGALLAPHPPLCAAAFNILLPHTVNRRLCGTITAALKEVVDAPLFCRNNYEFLLAKYAADENIPGSCAAICGETGGAIAAFSTADGFADDTAALWQKSLHSPPAATRTQHHLTLAEALEFTRFINREFPALTLPGATGGMLLQNLLSRCTESAVQNAFELYTRLMAESVTRIFALGGAETLLLLQIPAMLTNMLKQQLQPEIALRIQQRNFTLADRLSAPFSFLCSQNNGDLVV